MLRVLAAAPEGKGILACSHHSAKSWMGLWETPSLRAGGGLSYLSVFLAASRSHDYSLVYQHDDIGMMTSALRS